jgi:hypothetical protein
MTNYYIADVAGGGNNGNSGLTELLPWLTIAYAQAQLTGDQSDNSLLFKCGCTWREMFSPAMYGTAGHVFTIGSYSTGAKPIINGSNLLTSWTAETTYWYAAAATDPKQVLYDGTRLTRVVTKVEAITGKWWYDTTNFRVYIGDNPSGHILEASVRNNCIYLNSRSYITIDGLDCEKALQNNILLANSATYNTVENCVSSYAYLHGIKLWAGSGGNTYNTIDLNESSYNGGNGISIQDYSPNNTISRNSVHHNCPLEWEGSYSDQDFTAGIKVVSTTNAPCTIEENYVYLNGVGRSGDRGCGIWFDGAAHGHICRYNRVADNNMYGIQIELQHESKCYYNICTGHTAHAQAAGIFVGGTSTSVENNLVYNNVCYGNKYGITVMGHSPTANTCINNEVKNNISIGNTTRQLRCIIGGENDGTLGSGNVYLYNCLGAEATGFVEWGFGVYKNTYDAWEAAYGGSTSSVEADPLFTNAAGGDFTLQAGSPCIDAGVDLGSTYQISLMPGSHWPAEVITGNQNEHGRGWEIGAYIRSRINAALAVGGS